VIEPFFEEWDDPLQLTQDQAEEVYDELQEFLLQLVPRYR
jgi:hypothetical protein